MHPSFRSSPQVCLGREGKDSCGREAKSATLGPLPLPNSGLVTVKCSPFSL